MMESRKAEADTLVSMKDGMESTFEYIERVQSGQLVGVRTGFESLDQLTGGFRGGQVIVLAARPSVGKTALALNIARNHAIDFGGCVAFFSLETTRRELALRMLLGEGEIDNNRFVNGLLSGRDQARLNQAASVLENARVFLDDSMGSVSHISAAAWRIAGEQALSFLVVDYIQLMAAPQYRARREEELGDISRALKALAKHLDVPVLVLSQLNRGPENRPDKRPQLADLRDSGTIEDDADLVIFLYRDEVYDPETPDVGIAELLIAKQRNGPIGTVKLQFAKEYGRFHNLTPRGDDPQPDSGPRGDGLGGEPEPPF
jgi:replicative DNA helicase